jgi:hypothetical protein
MAYSGAGYPRWVTGEYPGLEGINTALKGFTTLLNDPGYKQLAGAQASDPAAQEYQGASDSGSGSASAPGLFGRLLAGQMGANVAGQAAQDQGQQAAQSGRVGANLAGANLMAGNQQSNLAVDEAQAKQATEKLGGFSSILKMITDPKGIGANIMSSLGGPKDTSPLGGIFGKIAGMFSGDMSPDTLGIGGMGGSLDPEVLAVLAAGGA